MTKLIILDRDGVINYDSKLFIKSPEEWHPLPGSLEAISALHQAGFTMVVASNQSGLARKYFDEATLRQIHDKMHTELKLLGGKIDNIFYCPHGPDDNCTCRKPKPGLLEQIANTYDISLDGVPAVGDSFRDIQAAQSAGATPVLVLTGNGQSTLQKHAQDLQDVNCYQDLEDFARFLLNNG